MITVYVDGHPVKVPPSMTVRHAVLRYDQKTYEMLRDGICSVLDEAGHEVDPEGAVFGGMQLFVTEAAG
jgi:hypothetical protein